MDDDLSMTDRQLNATTKIIFEMFTISKFQKRNRLTIAVEPIWYSISPLVYDLIVDVAQLVVKLKLLH